MDGFVVAYRPEWAQEFERERERLLGVLTPFGITRVEHIGSTSIPGMTAKPVLDLMAAVPDLASAHAATAGLAELGYRERPHRVDAVLVVHEPDRNLQLTTTDSDLWRERLAFRDALRADPALVAAYTRLKRDLLAANAGAGYTAPQKREFVRGVLRGAGVALRDDRHVG